MNAENANDTRDRILHHQNTEILQYKIYSSIIYDLKGSV